MAQASIEAHERNNTSMMRRLFQDASSPERVAALSQAIDFLEKQKFPWNDRYIATIEPNHQVELVMAGVAGENFMGRTQGEILIGQTADLPHPRPQRGENFSVTGRPWEREQGRTTPESVRSKPHDNRPEAKHPSYAPEPEKTREQQHPSSSSQTPQRGREQAAHTAKAAARETVRNVKESAFKVIDAGGMVMSLSSFLDGLLAGIGGGQSEPSDGNERIAQQQRAEAAIDEMCEAMERGEGFSAADIAQLPHETLLNMHHHGDAFVRGMIEDAQRDRERERDSGYERGR